MDKPNGITREQFESIRAMLEANRRRTRPMVHDLYDIFNAALIRMQTGCAWRQLPAGSPSWRTVHEHFTNWITFPRDGGRPVFERAIEQLGISIPGPSA